MGPATKIVQPRARDSGNRWRAMTLPLLAIVVAASSAAACYRLFHMARTAHETVSAVAHLQTDVLLLAALDETGETAIEAHRSQATAVAQRLRTDARVLATRLPVDDAHALQAAVDAYLVELDIGSTGGRAMSAPARDAADAPTLVPGDPVSGSARALLAVRLDGLVDRSDAEARRAAHRLIHGLSLIALLVVAAAVTMFLIDARRQRRAGASREARRLDARFRTIVEHTSEYVLVIDDSGRVHYASPKVEAVLQSSNVTTIDDVLRTVAPTSRARLAQLLTTPTSGPVEATVTTLDGRLLHMCLSVVDRRDDADIGGYVVTVRDVSTETQLEQRLHRQASTDELTGLPNRRGFTDAGLGALGRAQREHADVALVMIDVDGFKAVNDGLGHAAGDQLLVEVARRLRSECRAGEVVARLGGDEFAVLLEDMSRPVQAVRAAARMRAAIDEPFTLADTLMAVRASFGVAVASPSNGLEELFRRADVALYDAKDRGRNRIAVYESGMDDAAQTEMWLRREMVHGFASGEFTMAYQPLLGVRSGRPIGLEALMRWNSSVLGSVSPADFIAVAERSGMIVALGRWALHTACAQLVAWQRDHLIDDLTMSVNVSIAQLHDDGFVEDVEQVIAATGIAPSSLVLEVTESVFAARPEEVAAVLTRIREHGVEVSLDDFGSGYSSMRQLQQLPVDEIKIDRDFVRALGDGTARSRSVVDTLVALGRSMGLRTVAEGVEEVEQLQTLMAQRCDVAQGFLLARPMPPAEALAFLRGCAATDRPQPHDEAARTDMHADSDVRLPVASKAPTSAQG